MLTDRWADMTELVFAFRNFANVPKNANSKSRYIWVIRNAVSHKLLPKKLFDAVF